MNTENFTQRNMHSIDVGYLRDKRVILAPGQVAMFGYGSLLLQSNMELTLGHPYVRTAMPCKIRNWCRSWDVMMPNRNFYEQTLGADFIPKHIIYLNLRPQPGMLLNGLLYVLEPEEMDSFDQREWIYDRHAVSTALDDIVVEGGPAYAYVAKPEWRFPPDVARTWAALRRSYVNIIEEGLASLGAEFKALYAQSTDPLPLSLVFEDRRRDGLHPSPTNTRFLPEV
jgi:hypothetical protein